MISHIRCVAPILLCCYLASAPVLAATSLWWDTNYQLRFNVDVSVGAAAPDKGFNGYTARILALDTQALIAAGEMQADCSDLRITYYNGLTWQDLPRHILNCNTPSTDIRFAGW